MGLAPAVCAHPSGGRAQHSQLAAQEGLGEPQRPHCSPCPSSDPKHHLLSPKVLPVGAEGLPCLGKAGVWIKVFCCCYEAALACLVELPLLGSPARMAGQGSGNGCTRGIPGWSGASQHPLCVPPSLLPWALGLPSPVGLEVPSWLFPQPGAGGSILLLPGSSVPTQPWCSGCSGCFWDAAEGVHGSFFPALCHLPGLRAPRVALGQTQIPAGFMGLCQGLWDQLISIY